MVVVKGMVLIINGEIKINNLLDDDILNVLEIFDMIFGDVFVIFGFDEMIYMQVGGDCNVGFDLEYQEGIVDVYY